MNCNIDTLLKYAEEMKIAPNEDGYFVFLNPDRADVPEWYIKECIEKNVLINPTREELIKYSPRQTYYCDHMLDKVEGGCIVVEKKEVFWEEHEENYQKWLKETR